MAWCLVFKRRFKLLFFFSHTFDDLLFFVVCLQIFFTFDLNFRLLFNFTLFRFCDGIMLSVASIHAMLQRSESLVDVRGSAAGLPRERRFAARFTG